jgi:hypothetical protein
MTGTYQVCSKGVLGKFAVQLDVQMDDGQPCTGSMRAIPTWAPAPRRRGRRQDHRRPGACTGPNLDPDVTYTVCMTF